MPNYDFLCQNKDCQHTDIFLLTYDNRDNIIECEKCGGEMSRAYLHIQVRTPKTSQSFLSKTSAGGGRSGKEEKIMEELKLAAKADEEALKHRPGSPEYEGLKNEAYERKHFKPGRKK